MRPPHTEDRLHKPIPSARIVCSEKSPQSKTHFNAGVRPLNRRHDGLLRCRTTRWWRPPVLGGGGGARRGSPYLSLPLVAGQLHLLQHLGPLLHDQGLLIGEGGDVAVVLRGDKSNGPGETGVTRRGRRVGVRVSFGRCFRTTRRQRNTPTR